MTRSLYRMGKGYSDPCFQIQLAGQISHALYVWVENIGEICEFRMRSLVRWAGSKKKLLPKLSAYWNKPYQRYLEAFAGSASLYFHLAPEKALLNDLNNELMDAYDVLRNQPDEIYAAIIAIERSEETYYLERSKVVAKLSSFERAVRFFYLNRLCFNGIFRTNNQGEFNVSYGGVKSGSFPGLEEWREASALLAKADLYNIDFEEFLTANAKPGDFVYLDPPYAVSNRRIFRQYSAQTFGLGDVDRLSGVLDELNSRGCDFVVSYAKSPETKRIAGQWNVKQTLTQRNVAGFSEHRRRAVEVFMTNID